MRLLKIFLSFLFLVLDIAVTAQSNKKLLLAQSRFLKGSIHDSVFFLSELGDSIKSNKITFLPAGRLKIEFSKTAADSQWSYHFQNREIYISLVRNDSLYHRSYEITKSDNEKNFQFNRRYNYAAPVAKAGETMVFIDTPQTNNLVLQKKNRKKWIYEGDDISVFYSKKGLTHDSIEFMARGEFSAFHSDTLFLKAAQVETHNFYKKYTDSLHHTYGFFPDSLVSVKVPAKDLVGIYYHRSGWTALMTALTIGGLIGELIFLPTALLSKSDKTNAIFGNLAIVSIITWPTAATLGIVFSKKRFRLKETDNYKEIWRIVSTE